MEQGEDPIPCPVGTYNPNVEQFDSGHCLPCPAGYYCNTEVWLVLSLSLVRGVALYRFLLQHCAWSLKHHAKSKNFILENLHTDEAFGAVPNMIKTKVPRSSCLKTLHHMFPIAFVLCLHCTFIHTGGNWRLGNRLVAVCAQPTLSALAQPSARARGSNFGLLPFFKTPEINQRRSKKN